MSLSGDSQQAIRQIRTFLRQNTELIQSILGLLRTFLALGIPVFAVWFSGHLFEAQKPETLATIAFLQSNWALSKLPGWVLFCLAGPNLRYAILPVVAMIWVVLLGAFFVRDVYELKRLHRALSYIGSSFFGLDYPTITVDAGEIKSDGGEQNLLDAIGGPGYCAIQPGNAVIFRNLRQPSSTSVTGTYFMAPFERIGQIADLDEQQGYLEEASTITRDGIQVKLTDVRFRYRIATDIVNGKPLRPSLQNPYPYSEKALNNMTYNLSVSKTGLDTWHQTVSRVVVGAIMEFINANDIDFLTAPREEGKNPRLSMKNEVFAQGIQKALEGNGAELLWVDVGHIDIVREEVDSQRVDLWSTDLMGDARVKQAYGDAIYQVNMEVGRAEAQAELIISIANAFQNIRLGPNSRQDVQRLLVARTAQVLDAFHDQLFRDQPAKDQESKSQNAPST